LLARTKSSWLSIMGSPPGLQDSGEVSCAAAGADVAGEHALVLVSCGGGDLGGVVAVAGGFGGIAGAEAVAGEVGGVKPDGGRSTL